MKMISSVTLCMCLQGLGSENVTRGFCMSDLIRLDKFDFVFFMLGPTMALESRSREDAQQNIKV